MLELLFLLLPIAMGYGWFMGRNSIKQKVSLIHNDKKHLRKRKRAREREIEREIERVCVWESKMWDNDIDKETEKIEGKKRVRNEDINDTNFQATDLFTWLIFFGGFF